MELNKNKETILNLLKQIKRDGMDKLIEWIEKNDYFVAPASSKFHLCTEGGLAQHSLNVYNLFKDKCKKFKIEIKDESIILCGLLHDLCKVNQYDKTSFGYKMNYKLPLGHGEKSLFLLQNFIKLHIQEALIIRWHMGLFYLSNENKKSFFTAIKRYPECLLLHTSDWESLIYEK